MALQATLVVMDRQVQLVPQGKQVVQVQLGQLVKLAKRE
jgi:hypothetical protein